MNPNEEAPDLIGVGAQAIVSNAGRLGLTWQLKLATVENGIDSAAISAIFDNDSVAIPMISTIGTLLTGTRVYVIEVPPAGNFIVGVVAVAPLATNVECTNVFGMTPGNTTSATFVTMPGTPTVQLFKTSDRSRLMFNLSGTFFSNLAVAGLVAGVRLSLGGAVDLSIAAVSSTNSSLGNHTTYAGLLIADPVTTSGGLPAGLYTFTGIWKRPAGTGTLTVDSGDVWSLCVQEVP